MAWWRREIFRRLRSPKHAKASAEDVQAVIAEVRLLSRADALLLEPGLREAEAMNRAMGAPDPADRLARELAA